MQTMALRINILIILLIILGTNVIGVLEISESLYYFFLILLSIFPILHNYPSILKEQSQLTLLIFTLLYSMYMLYVDRGEGTRSTAMAIVGPPMLLSALPIHYKNAYRYQHFWHLIMIIIICGFISETFLSIYERISGRNVFGWHGEIIFSLDILGSIEYRSTALYGHPLGNALLVSTAMSFILISNLKNKIKYPLWLLGYLSILCFNTRGSIVGNALLLITYIGYILISKKKMKDSTKISIMISALLIVFVGYFSIFHFGFGGRLLDMGLVDDSSAQVRIDAWSVFESYSIKDFLYLHSFNEVLMIKYSLGLNNLENPWLGILLRNGLLFLIPYVVLYYILIKKILREYGLFEKLFVTTTYFLLASTSNSFDTSFISLFYFLLLCVLFTPSLFKAIVKRKYLM